MKQNKKVMVYFAGVWIFLLLLFQFGPKQSLKPFRTNELELFQGNISQDLLFIDMPTLDLKPYQVNQYPFLPPLYLGLPSDIPYNVQVFLEKRNQYIHQFAKSFLSQANYSESPFISPFEKIQQIREILPCQYNQREALAVLSDNLILLDQSLELLSYPHEMQGSYSYNYHGHIISTQFPDRFWKQYSVGGSGGIKAYLQQIQLSPKIQFTPELLIGDNTSENIPFKQIKAIHIYKDPQLVPTQSSFFGNAIYTGILSLWVMAMWYLIQLSQKRLQRMIPK